MFITPNTKIREWYTHQYPTDSLGKRINDSVTFSNMLVALEEHKDVYDILDVTDSLIRERTFNQLCDVMNVGYDYIYRQWLWEDGRPKKLSKKQN